MSLSISGSGARPSRSRRWATSPCEGVVNPAWLPEGTKINIMNLDTNAILGTTGADKARFSNLFGG